MVDYDGIRAIVVQGLEKYLNCPVIRSNQNADIRLILEKEENERIYPYVVYTVTTIASENKGTWGEYADGKDRNPVTQTWSITAISDNNTESVMLANKAREWLGRVGTVYLSDNGIVVQSVGSITNRDNFLTVEYEYINGFDAFLWLYDEIDSEAANAGYIETASFEHKALT